MSKKLDVICALLKSLLNLPIFKSFRRVNPEILVNFRRILLDVFCKKGVLLKTSLNSQENTLARDSLLMKLQV